MIAEEPRASFHQPRIPEGKDSTTTFQADSQQVGILVSGNGNVKMKRHFQETTNRKIRFA